MTTRLRLLTLLLALLPLATWAQTPFLRESTGSPYPAGFEHPIQSRRPAAASTAARAAACAVTTTLNFAQRTVGEDWKNLAPIVVGAAPRNTTISTAGTYVEPVGGTETSLAVGDPNFLGNTLMWYTNYTAATSSTTQITYSFNRPVNNFSLRIQDVDVGSNFIDAVTFDALQPDGTPLSLSTANDASVQYNSAFTRLQNNTILGIQNNADGQANGTVTVTFNKPITSFKITYQNRIQNLADPGVQYIGIDYMTWCTQANITTTLVGPDHAQPTTQVTYNVVTRNSGDYAATNVIPQVQLPAGMRTRLTLPTGSVYDNVTGLLRLPAVANLAVGATNTTSFSFTMNGTAVTGTASATMDTDDSDPADNNGSLPAATVTTGVNVRPNARNQSATIRSSATAFSSLPALDATDADGDAMQSFTIVGSTLANLTTYGRLYYMDGATRRQISGSSDVTLTPAQAASLQFQTLTGATTGTTSFQYTATDVPGGVDLSPATYTIDIVADLPAVYTSPNTYFRSTLTNGQVLATVSDPDGNITVATVTRTGGTAGGINFNPVNGAFTASFSNNPGRPATGLHTFSVTTTDALGGTTTQNVSIRILGDAAEVEAVYSTPNRFNRDGLALNSVLATVTDGNADIVSATRTAGTLPTGMGFNTTTGEFFVSSNTPPTAATRNFTVDTRDAAGGTSSDVPVSIVIFNDTESAYTVAAARNVDNYPAGFSLASASDADGAISSASLASGTLPAGVAFNTTTGAFTVSDPALLVAGNYAFSVNTVDATGGKTTQPVIFSLTPDREASYAASPVSFNRDGLALNSVLLAAPADADGTISTFTLASGTLPAGINFTASGRFVVSSNTPPAVGTYNFVVNTVDATGGKTAVPATINIFESEAVYTVAPARNVESYSAGFSLASVADADGAINSATLASGTLPAGVALNATTGEFTVSNPTLLVAGSYALSVATTDATGGKTTQPVSLVFTADRDAVYSAPVSFNRSALTNNQVLASVTDADGAISSATLASGTLPAGIAFNPSTGQFTAAFGGSTGVTRPVAGTYNFTVNTVDATGGRTTALPVRITIFNDTEAVYSTPNSFNRDGLANGTSLATVTDANGAITAATLASGTLPSGMGFNPGTGQFTVNNAMAPLAGTYDFTVATTDATGGTSPAVAVSITVYNDTEAAYSTANTFNRDALSNGTSLATVTDGNGAISSASLVSGTLPSGMGFNPATGQFTVNSATAPAVGVYNFTVNTVDATGGRTTALPVRITIGADQEAVYSSPNRHNREAQVLNSVLATVTDADGAISSAAITAGTLPSGMGFNPATGAFFVSVGGAGRPANGTYTFTVSTTDATGGTSSQVVSVVLFGDADATYSTGNVFNQDALSNGRTLATVTDANGAITTASLASGTMPAGLQLDATTGRVSVANAGAVATGNHVLSVNTVDATGGRSAVPVTITINPDKEAQYTVAPKPSGAYADNQALATVTDADGTITVAQHSAGVLPPGVALDAATGRLFVSNRRELVPNGNYRVTITTTDVTGGITTQELQLSINALPLPVELTRFEVQAAGFDAQLNWTTASEKNNDRFEVERSFDGHAFTAVGQVQGHGSTAQATTYAFADRGVGRQPRLVYYRLKQVDFDGTTQYGPIRSVRFGASPATPAVELYPNPTTGLSYLDLQSLPAGTYQVRVSDLAGRTVLTTTAGTGSPEKLDLSALPSGSYVVTVSSPALRLTKQLVKRD
ncbi:putative Ig domain-containing protein [Hymenobacter sp. B81]|uniref:putative Ig domain-containing protein n=1 Tax=Hymenobacter sp. B81 TaxID=3344878 RepID=UPI0037DC8D56